MGTESVGIVFFRFGGRHRFSWCRTGRFSRVPPVQDMGYNEQKSHFFTKLKTRARFGVPSGSNPTGAHLWVKKLSRSIYDGFRGARSREPPENRSESPRGRFRIFMKCLILTQIERARSPRSGGVRRRCWVFLKGISMKF